MTPVQNHTEHKIIAIVDAYSSGALYPAEFKKRGYDCVHIQSSLDLHPGWFHSFQPGDFIAKLVHQGDLDATIRQLSPYSPDAVIAGAECGVILADALSEKMGLKTNGTKLSEARRNKYLTHELLREHGVPSAHQIKSDRIDNILNWATTRNIWPVVIKPLNSAGSDCVQICHSSSEIKEAFASIVGKKNQMHLVNHEVLAQEFLEGDEYIVDTVSCEGQHNVCAIFRYKKIHIHRQPVYENQILLPVTGPVQKALCDYSLQVLEAFNFKYGPTHLEMMLTKRGPVLVEINARLDGAMCPLLIHECTGYGQVQRTADAYLNRDQFFKLKPHPYELKKNGMILHFISEQSGLIQDLCYLDRIKELPSFFSLNLNVHKNEFLEKTIDLISSPGHVKLAHEDLAVLNRDYEAIRQWEREGIFVVR